MATAPENELAARSRALMREVSSRYVRNSNYRRILLMVLQGLDEGIAENDLIEAANFYPLLTYLGCPVTRRLEALNAFRAHHGVERGWEPQVYRYWNQFCEQLETAEEAPAEWVLALMGEE